VFLTSTVSLKHFDAEQGEATDIKGVRVIVKETPNEKCVRCYHRVEDVGTYAEHPQLGGRCIVNVDGEGEPRQFV